MQQENKREMWETGEANTRASLRFVATLIGECTADVST